MSRLQKSNSEAGFVAKNFIKSSTALSTAVLLVAGLPTSVLAQTARPQTAGAPTAVEEVVVTGTRIVREGYEAPTPLSVVDASALENRSVPDLGSLMAQMPSFAGAGIAQTQNTYSGGTGGLDNVNLRALGISRTLVLLDGQRTVASTVGGQGVDVGSYPQQLISRVDIVTGGASAVYGSDAVAGVVNFVLDKTFTGVKGEVSHGFTNYGDLNTSVIDLTGGFGFADNRGHMLLSFEEAYNGGIVGDGGRAWDRTGTQVITNPTYTATNGQPNQLVLQNVGRYDETPGGIVVSPGPLRGLVFGTGGSTSFINAPLISGTQFVGGDWASTEERHKQDMVQHINRLNFFTRVSYDISDNINVFLQSYFTAGHVWAPGNTAYTNVAANEAIVTLDNAYLPASVRAAMVANNLTRITIGSWNEDLGFEYSDIHRTVSQTNLGAEGNFDAFGTNWKWDAHGSYGVTNVDLKFYNTAVTANFLLATDAVISPITGAVVCRIKLTVPTSKCQPWNPMGVGVNTANKAGKDYLTNGQIPGSFSNNKIEQGDFAAALTGDVFSVPAGPVSMALSLEHRIESVHDVSDPDSLALAHIQANPPNVSGKVTVNEGAVETVVPLFKGAPWAASWDFNGAVRATNYSSAGYVTTWKVGTVYAPIDDIKFRVTRSRDIRAPNAQDLFQTATFATQQITDSFNGTRPFVTTYSGGNANLLPEKADTTGIGAVLAPRFLDGFTASVDYWDVNLKGGIASVSGQNIIDSCYLGTHPELCGKIVRLNGIITSIFSGNQNVASQDLNGVDVEASYHFEMSNLINSWNGDVSLHSNATYYMNNKVDNKIVAATNHVGENVGGTPPRWKATIAATYKLDPITFTLTGRAVSAGVINSEYIECTSGCPASSPTHQTINNNRLPGMFYLDANIQYAFEVGGAKSTAFFNVRNMTDQNPKAIPTAPPYANLATMAATLYDVDGVVFRMGLRFKM